MSPSAVVVTPTQTKLQAQAVDALNNQLWLQLEEVRNIFEGALFVYFLAAYRYSGVTVKP